MTEHAIQQQEAEAEEGEEQWVRWKQRWVRACVSTRANAIDMIFAWEIIMNYRQACQYKIIIIMKKQINELGLSADKLLWNEMSEREKKETIQIPAKSQRRK